MQVQVNYLAVVVAALVNFLLATLWYTVLFGKAWKKLTGISEMKPKGSNIVLAFIGSFLLSYVLYHSLVFGDYYTHMSGVSGGLMGGFFDWLGFIAPVTLMLVLYEKRSWKLWLLDNGFWLVSLLVMGAMLSAWQ